MSLVSKNVLDFINFLIKEDDYDGSHGNIYSVKLPNNCYYSGEDDKGNLSCTPLDFLCFNLYKVKKMSFNEAEYCISKFGGEIVVL